MEFPVFVASDVHREKVNLALRYNPRTTTLDRFLRSASRCFDDVARFTRKGSLPPFSAAYLYSDVQCQWDVLQDRTQLSPCCQVYVFRHQAEEAVAVIPEPVESSELLLVLKGRFNTASFSTVASTVRQPSPINSPASTSPMLLASNRWALPQGSQHSATSRLRFGAPSSPCKGSAPLLRFADLTTSDTATHTDAHAGGFHNARPMDASVAFQPVRSHRFRLQIFSPPAETPMRGQGANRSTPNMYASLTERAASEPQALYLKPTRPYSSDLYKLPPASPPERGEVAIPRSWYDPSSHSFRSVAPRPRGSGQLPPQSSSVASRSRGAVLPSSARGSRQRPRMQTDESDPHLLVHREPRSGDGVSILREERERVSVQMRLEIDDLRSHLREETRQLKRTLNGAHCTVAIRR
ncbi:hypothetical protein LSCM4_02114 [Leishmania orientalis]|uniref:BILBO1 N-terminal domain-containing protein n=1 Tax=Leishmania orientalis TaxID=2249476 RepID=A0A836KG37_9TRYP|nr:hypothetical protein LSCM4_02114 [Leishmania orientalis]